MLTIIQKPTDIPKGHEKTMKLLDVFSLVVETARCSITNNARQNGPAHAAHLVNFTANLM